MTSKLLMIEETRVPRKKSKIPSHLKLPYLTFKPSNGKRQQINSTMDHLAIGAGLYYRLDEYM